MGEREELEEVDESAFGKLVAGAVEQCVVVLKYLMAKLAFEFGGTILKYRQGPTPTSTKT